MADSSQLISCVIETDQNGRELIRHGTTAFPIACYYDNLSENEVSWHWHEEFEAAVITEGACTVTAANEKYIMHVGEGFFINSGILHGAWDLDMSNCHFHSIVFHPRLIGGSLDSVFHQNYVHPLTQNTVLESLALSPSILWQKAILDTIESVWQFLINKPAGFEFRVRNELSELIFLLHSNLPALKSPTSQKSIRNGERIKQMLQFIHTHYQEELSISAIAEVCSISESECLRCFKTTIQTTPIQYVRHYRIQNAIHLLTTTEMNISDVASACGFQDLSYFTKTFREMKGIAPGEYRKNFNQNPSVFSYCL